MHFRHGPEISRWDHFWDQRMHFHVLLMITHDDFG